MKGNKARGSFCREPPEGARRHGAFFRARSRAAGRKAKSRVKPVGSARYSGTAVWPEGAAKAVNKSGTAEVCAFVSYPGRKLFCLSRFRPKRERTDQL